MSVFTFDRRIIDTDKYPWSTFYTWTPAKISTQMWLDAADSKTITIVSDKVSEWQDKSGNNRHATQGTPENRPAYSIAALNGKNAVAFSGDYLAFESAVIGTAHTLFVVFRPVLSATTVGTVFGQWASGQTGRIHWSMNQDCKGDASSGRLNIFNSTATSGGCVGGAGIGGMAIDVAMSNTATIISSTSALGTENWKLHKNGTEWDSVTITSVYTGINSAIGSLNATASINPYSGEIFEIVLINSSADIDTRQKLEGYLAHKWILTSNLPSDHPYKTRAPRA